MELLEIKITSSLADRLEAYRQSQGQRLGLLAIDQNIAIAKLLESGLELWQHSQKSPSAEQLPPPANEPIATSGLHHWHSESRPQHRARPIGQRR